MRCKGWKQEAILRMLENNLENAEDPSRLIVYGGIAKAARNWESYYAIVDALKILESDETLVIQAGMPVAVFRTHRLAPRVLMGLTNVINASWPMFYDLIERNLYLFALDYQDNRFSFFVDFVNDAITSKRYDVNSIAGME